MATRLLHFETISPAFTDCDHCIVFYANDDNIALTAVAIQSIVANASVEDYYDIILFHEGISRSHIEKYNRQWLGINHCSLRFFNIGQVFDQEYLSTGKRLNIAREVYHKLFIPWMFSAEYKLSLYLDGDMILRHDLSPIFCTDLGSTLIGAVRDYSGINDCYTQATRLKQYRLSLGLDNLEEYVMSSPLLFNLTLWKKKFSLEFLCTLCESHKWRQPNHDILNVLCQHQITYLSPTWGMRENHWDNCYHIPNHLLRELSTSDDATVVHFCGDGKPYRNNYSKYNLEFWHYADETPYIADLMNRIQSVEYRSYVAYSINKDNITVEKNGKNLEMYYKGTALGPQNQGWQHIRVIRINNQVLHLEGSVRFFSNHRDEDITMLLRVNDGFVQATNSYHEQAIGETLKKAKIVFGHAFVFDIPLSKNENSYHVELKVFLKGQEVPLSKFVYHSLSELSGVFTNEYYTNDGWTVRTSPDGFSLMITKNTLFSFARSEWRFLSELSATKTWPARKAIIVRLVVHVLKRLRRKPIWLISDRLAQAGDNGEVFYKFLKENKKKEVEAYFILSSGSDDYNRMKQLGGIIAPLGWRHKMLALMADWYVSSQLNHSYREPFKKRFYRDMVRKTRFAYIKHGVIATDNTRRLDKDHVELDGIVTATIRENETILKGAYHYTEKQVWLTGLPRFDRLKDKRSKVITILPTWRRYLFSKFNPTTGIWLANDDFERSDYVCFYRDLLNNCRLKAIINKHGYFLQFMLHPTCRDYIHAFQIPHDVLVPSASSYQIVYESSSLIITDYSSSIYDFIYLRKPIVYCQFDTNHFFSGNHTCDKGDFDYELEGFGEVTHSIPELIAVIENYLGTGCSLHEPYKSRIERAFPDREPTHCERLFKKIMGQGQY